jgi:hypothetical protein
LPQQAEAFSCDLHVLSTPPAFILSQDQTLHFNLIMGLMNSTMKSTEFGSTGRHYLVFKDQEKIAGYFESRSN